MVVAEVQIPTNLATRLYLATLSITENCDLRFEDCIWYTDYRHSDSVGSNATEKYVR